MEKSHNIEIPLKMIAIKRAFIPHKACFRALLLACEIMHYISNFDDSKIADFFSFLQISPLRKISRRNALPPQDSPKSWL